MSETKEYGLAPILTVVTGRLIGKFSDAHKFIEWMAAEPVYPNQFKRVFGEATKVLVAWYPAFSEIMATSDDEELNTEEKANAYIDRCAKILGGYTLQIPRLDEAQHERIDVLSELVETVHPSKIMVARVPE